MKPDQVGAAGHEEEDGTGGNRWEPVATGSGGGGLFTVTFGDELVGTVEKLRVISMKME